MKWQQYIVLTPFVNVAVLKGQTAPPSAEPALHHSELQRQRLRTGWGWPSVAQLLMPLMQHC